ncbi:MAG: hypothetical protein C7B46_16520 [Sulfobacillus benefaciens]|uniref:HTH cro/C1-type domain-containing protein n=1 Tax=Sulfobacillus benefaciens TaxID=453960 RepID=A0A2T2XAV5_9FIRM|nr:MAG: hypothetical protein C7B46_16520 [Sulfobacillus benefaciens]
MAGISPATVLRLERGGIGSLRTYERIAKAFQTSLINILPEFKAPSRPTLEDLELLDNSMSANPSDLPDLPVGNWSPTRLTDWLLCPAKGAWSTGVFDVPPDFQWPINERATVGKAVHQYAENRLDGADVNTALMGVADKNTGMDPELWLPFVEAWDASIHPTIGMPLAIERRLEVTLKGHRITAVIDVVDAHGTIRDLKTTQRLPNPTAIARESVQAPIYVAAWRETTGEMASFALDYLAQHKSGIEYTQMPIPVTETDIDRVTRQLDYAADFAARPERITPNPVNKYGCTSCTFLALCHEKFGTLTTLDAPRQTVAVS